MSAKRAFRWWECPKCRAHYNTNEALDFAFASVGIEYAKGSAQMADEYFRGYHADHSAAVPRRQVNVKSAPAEDGDSNRSETETFVPSS